MHRYFYDDKTLMIEIVVDPLNTVVRPATPQDKKDYPQQAQPKHDERDEDKKK